MIAIFILSSRTSSDMNVLLPFFQSIFPNMKSFDWGHFVAYFALAFSLDYGFGRRADRLHFKLLIVLLCGAYGLTDEYHQTFVGGRTPDIYDIRNDCIGAAIAMIVVAIPPIHRVWRRGAN
ncbi:VanZ family protein [Paenibacillus baekrokdamisoli]|nr:VanZ family protein [Paenibacillus baekrokdamisoli]